MVGCGWIWLDMVGYVWVWLDMVGYGWVWLDMVGCGCVMKGGDDARQLSMIASLITPIVGLSLPKGRQCPRR